MSSTPSTISGRGWARTGLVLGGLVSIAANVAHSFIPPHGAPAGWHPQIGAVVGAIVWPVFLFVAIEILARVAWPSSGWYKLLRFGGMLPVALVAGLVSYRHLSGLLAYYGEEPMVYHLGPLAVDGLMVMATAALLAIGHTSRLASSVKATDELEPAAKPQRRPSAADRVIEARMRHPRANLAYIARTAGVKPATARRILETVPTSPAHATLVVGRQQ